MRIMPNYLKVSSYDKLGMAVAQYGLVLSAEEVIQEMSFINFADLYDYRVSKFNKVNDSEFLRTVTFKGSDGEEKKISFKLEKRVGRIDLKGIEKANVKLLDLMRILCLHPEINIMLQEASKEPECLGFTKYNNEKKGHRATYYQLYRKENVSELKKKDVFIKTKLDGTVLEFGHDGRILAKLLFDFGKHLELPEYSITIPETDQEKAIYEVELMTAYYRKDFITS